MTIPYEDCDSDTPWCCGCDRYVCEVCYDCGYCEDCCTCEGAWEEDK